MKVGEAVTKTIVTALTPAVLEFADGIMNKLFEELGVPVVEAELVEEKLAAREEATVDILELLTKDVFWEDFVL